MTLAVAGLMTIAAIDAYLAASGPTRRATWLTLVEATVYAAMLTILVVQQWRGWGGTDTALFAYDLVVVATAATLVVDLVRARWSEGTAADLVVTLGERASAATFVTCSRRASVTRT